ncbi:FAD-binding domain-containing protein [Candidatus Cyanaurora vandensis]|uniref:FAD-binding domain-containing protein n=1 Tax=Candidatus Cyanaurora vandensis TaxID=2714958 RepID=UPI00257D306E|nr:FAD-binding domain-containing protein [Candidatus Cyanaurora vandensis]
MSKDMRRDFTDRADLIRYVGEQFPEAAARDGRVSPIRGGRRAAEVQLNRLETHRYATTRNFLNGSVSRLSPYIRYGVLNLAQVRDWVLARATPHQCEKFVNELGWRDYWQRLYLKLGQGIWEDREPYKTGYSPQHYQDTLPEDIQSGTTGLVCMDVFSQELKIQGYLHNHARMWLAAYLVHWRHLRWQTGAKWFLEHLIDGDPASNNLSWQWVASTFGAKPYFFNRENLERYTAGLYCRRCPLYGHCAFEGSYDDLAHNLFPRNESPTAQPGRKPKAKRR